MVREGKGKERGLIEEVCISRGIREGETQDSMRLENETGSKREIKKKKEKGGKRCHGRNRRERGGI